MTEELARRPRRKLVTPLTATLAGVLIAALGFLGGVQVQKSAAAPAAGAGAGGFARARAAGGAGGGGFTPPGGGGSATVGAVANVDGRTFYVTGADGTTVRVKTTKSSKVTRTAVSTVGEVHPGDTVVVQGTKSSSGTVTATSVTATAKNAAGAFGGPPAGATQGRTNG